MLSDLLNFIAEYGLDVVLLALGINVATAVFKRPLKAFAKKFANGERFTRFLVFLPVVLGFGLTIAYRALTKQSPLFAEGFYNLWFSSSSLSLTFYAIWEKIFPSKKRAMKNCEWEANRNLLDVLQKLSEQSRKSSGVCVAPSESGTDVSVGTDQPNAQTEDENSNLGQRVIHKKIVLGGKRNVEAEKEKVRGETDRI